jgi:hypothetical protein
MMPGFSQEFTIKLKRMQFRRIASFQLSIIPAESKWKALQKFGAKDKANAKILHSFDHYVKQVENT